MTMLEDSPGEGSYEVPETQIKQGDSLQCESIKIRLEKETEPSNSWSYRDSHIQRS